MELKKGQNMIEHEAEIYSKPARTWFQSGKDKLKAEGMWIVATVSFLRLMLCRLAVSKRQYEAGADALAREKQKKPVDANKVYVLFDSCCFIPAHNLCDL